MSHTPGPWEASEGWPSDVWHVDMSDGRYSVIVSRADESAVWSAEESQANARLIAAAPDMLDALRTADDALDYAQAQVDSDKDRDRLRQWRTRVQNVIALAEGR